MKFLRNYGTTELRNYGTTELWVYDVNGEAR